MFIQTQETPNPLALKFLPPTPVLSSGTLTFSKSETDISSQLARDLLNLEGVTNVFFGADFITVSKEERSDWANLKPVILATIMDYFMAGRQVEHQTTDFPASAEEDDEVVKQIKELIEQRVRPAVAQDGGDIIYRGFKDGTVFLELQGSCAGCPSSTMTLKSGIENMLMHYVPEVKNVEAV